MAEPLLRVHELRIRFPTTANAVAVVDGLNLSIRAGESVGLVGESGCGKTVTALSLGGLLPAAEIGGHIQFQNCDLTRASPSQLRQVRGAGIGFVFQEPMTSLNPVLAIGPQVTEAVQAHHALANKAARQRCLALLQEVGIADAATRYAAFPHELSGGQRQRVMLAMALAGEPKLLVADEPTTALDVTIQAQILNLIQTLGQRRNMALLLVTHDLAVVSQMCERVLIMSAGKIVEEGKPKSLRASANHDATRALLSHQPRLEVRKDAQPVAQATPILAAKNLSCSFSLRGRNWWRRDPSRLVAVDGVSFSLWATGRLGLVGESGSGKSTMARLLTGLVRGDRGELEFEGRAQSQRNSNHRSKFRRAVQMTFQDPLASLNPKFTVEEAIAEGLIIHGARPGIQVRESVVKALARVGLQRELLRRFPHQLSGGQRQRVTIARALITRPQVLICDEPVASLDGPSRTQILELLDAICAEEQLSLMLISHDLSVIARLCDEVAVMYLGQVVEQGPTAEIFRRPRHPYTQALLDAVPDWNKPLRAPDGEIASMVERPDGCFFHPRCIFAEDRCRQVRPELRRLAPNHAVRCILDELPRHGRPNEGGLYEDGSART